MTAVQKVQVALYDHDECPQSNPPPFAAAGEVASQKGRKEDRAGARKAVSYLQDES